MNKSEINRCEKIAKDGLDFLDSVFLKRDDVIRSNQRATWVGEDGAMHFSVTFADEKNPFGETDADIIMGNLMVFGGFDDMQAAFDRGNTEITVSGIVGGKPANKKKERYIHRELTVADLIRFIKENPKDFPKGLKSKISIGDYEGNSYSRRMTLGTDDGRLYISHEYHGDFE